MALKVIIKVLFMVYIFSRIFKKFMKICTAQKKSTFTVVQSAEVDYISQGLPSQI